MRSAPLVTSLLLALACTPSPVSGDPDAGSGGSEGEGEGEGAAEGEGEPAHEGEGEGEGEPGEGEGEGDPACSASPPEDPGTVTVEQQDHELEVEGRTLALTLLLPEQAGAAAVVVLHPGFQLGSADYRSYGEHLASHGVAAVLLDPPYALFGGPTHVELASMVSAILDWLEDESSGGALAGRVDAARVVLAGHSLGGKIALLTATRDARPRGVFAIDPVDAAGGPGASPSADNPSVTPELMPLVNVPVALVGETVNATCTGLFCQPCAPEAESFARYYEAAAGPAWQAEVLGANHMSFLDDPACGFTCNACGAGTDDPVQTRRLTRRWLTAFVAHLDGDACARAWLAGAPMDAEVARGAVLTEQKQGF
ncbi:MAG: hypothetical protein IT383_13600 [Deltaproteobacteria bacterium]|nr:hypothetical protein [Deltaproteobacteria bacterium]